MTWYIMIENMERAAVVCGRTQFIRVAFIQNPWCIYVDSVVPDLREGVWVGDEIAEDFGIW